MISDYFKLALKSIRHRGLRSWLTILGIVIGIAAVVALISLGAGLKAAVLGQFGTLSVDKLTIQNKGAGFGPPGSTVIEKLTNHDVNIIESVQGVDLVIPRLIRVGQLEYNDVAGFGYGSDIPEDQEKIDIVYESTDLKIDKGRLLEEGDSGVILLGSMFGETEDFGKPITVGKKIILRGNKEMTFEVVGILEKSSSFQLNSVVFIMSDDMQELFGIENEWDLIIAQVDDKDKIDSIAEEISRKLRNDRNEKLGEETFTVETPLSALEAVNTILNIVNAIVVAIAMISLIVGGVGITNTMYTSVLERTKEIGTMKAVGAQNKDILWIFLIESGFVGLVGGILGALIGLSAALGVSSIANSALGNDLFKVSIDYMLLAGAVSFSFVVGIVAGVVPAIQASKLNVVDALRS